MDVTIKGKKKNQDIRLTDDRLICENTEYLYGDISAIWVGGLFNPTLDVTYKGWHRAFKIDKEEQENAKRAAEEVQNKIDEIVESFTFSAAEPKPLEEVFAFCKMHSLKSFDVSEKNFCSWFGRVMDRLDADETVLLPFESTGFFKVTEKGIIMSMDQLIFAGAATDRRLVLCQGVVKDGKVKIVPYEEIEKVGIVDKGMMSDVFVKCRNEGDNVALKDVSHNLAKRLADVIQKNQES